MPSLGPAEILVILVVALLVFGPNKMPEIAGRSARASASSAGCSSTSRASCATSCPNSTTPSTTTVEQQPVPMLPPKDDTVPTPDGPNDVVPPVADAPVRRPRPSVTPLPSAEPDAPGEPA